MTISNRKKVGLRFIACLVFLLLCLSAFHNWLAGWNEKYYDILLTWRANHSSLQLQHDPSIVHVDLDDSSIAYFQQHYLNRTYHAKVIENLSAMGVAAQAHDFIFAAPKGQDEDQILIDKTASAANVYFGIAFRLTHAPTKPDNEPMRESQIPPAIAEWRMPLSPEAPAHLINGKQVMTTYPALATAARGLGFLNVLADPDGVIRRTPLLIRAAEHYYPSFAFRIICDYLGVPPASVSVGPNKVVLHGALVPTTGQKTDIVIPVDSKGQMRISYIGPWDAMTHYRFSDIWQASGDRGELELWRDELAGKIAIVADVTTGASDMSMVPTDSSYPLSGVSASAIHTILTNQFITESPSWILAIWCFGALSLLFQLSRSKSTALFITGGLSLLLVLIIGSALLFCLKLLLLPAVTMGSVVLLYLPLGLVFRAVEHARSLHLMEIDREVYRKELEIGQNIQRGFLPSVIPETQDWEFQVYFKPAKQVSGDFYDIFPLKDGSHTALVIADVCDKGVGSALFMALSRSLIRAFTQQEFTSSNDLRNDMQKVKLQRIVSLTNDYIAGTHGDSNMFTTLFLGILDHTSGELNFVNCGHEPPIIFRSDRSRETLNPTGPALGLMPEMVFAAKTTQIHLGELFFSYTDGVTDVPDGRGIAFGKESLVELVNNHSQEGKALFERIVARLQHHGDGAEQFDDITMLSVRRQM